MDTLKIDIVSDIVCPWCVIGFRNLKKAMEELKAELDFKISGNPKVEKMLKKASIPLADIAEQNLKMNAGEKSEKAIKKHAEDWIKANQSTFDSWIN